MTRRDVWLAIVSVFVGPLIGSLTFIATASAIDAMAYAGNAPVPSVFLENWPFVLSTGYVFGAVPWLLFAITMAILSRHLPTLRGRFSAAALVGVMASGAILGFVLSGGSRPTVDWVVLASVAFTGAMAGVVSLALVEWFHPLPAKATT
jgi:hypothetical protein